MTSDVHGFSTLRFFLLVCSSAPHEPIVTSSAAFRCCRGIDSPTSPVLLLAPPHQESNHAYWAGGSEKESRADAVSLEEARKLTHGLLQENLHIIQKGCRSERLEGTR